MSFKLSDVKFYFPDESTMKKMNKNLAKAVKQLNALKRRLKKLDMQKHHDEKDVDNLEQSIDKAYKLVGKYQLVPTYFYANNKKYVKKNFLGAGGFGSVHVYESKNNHKLVLKNFTRYSATNNEEKLINMLMKEKNYDCGVTPLKSHFHTLNGKKKVFSIMPLMIPIRKIALTPNQKIQCFLSVIRQVQCLMRYGMYYYDLKPDNVLSSLKNVTTNGGRKHTLKECSTKKLFRNQFFLGDLGSIWSRRYTRDSPLHTYNFIGNNLKKTKHQIHVLNIKIICIIFLLDLFKLNDEAEALEYSKTRANQFENLKNGLDKLYPRLKGVMGYNSNNVPRHMNRQQKLKFIRNLKNWVFVPVALTNRKRDLFV